MAIPQEKLGWMYATMYRIRRFEERLLEETQKGNAMGVAHTSVARRRTPPESAPTSPTMIGSLPLIAATAIALPRASRRTA